MLHEQFDQQNVANSIENERFELKNAANTVSKFKRQLPAPKCYKFHQNAANSMENERFQLQNVAKTVEMAASSSKMLQIGKRAEKQIQTNITKREKHNSQNNSGPNHK